MFESLLLRSTARRHPTGHRSGVFFAGQKGGESIRCDKVRRRKTPRGTLLALILETISSSALVEVLRVERIPAASPPLPTVHNMFD